MGTRAPYYPARYINNKKLLYDLDDEIVFQRKDSTKRALCVVQPDADLQRFLTQLNIMKWWQDIYERLGITSIEDLRFIGKVECCLNVRSIWQECLHCRL